MLAAIIAAFGTLLNGGSIKRAITYLLLAANLTMVLAIAALSIKDIALQTQLDTLTRELEEVKRKLKQ